MTLSRSHHATQSAARTHFVLAGVAILFSLNYIIGKIALRSFEPFAFAWLRVGGSAVLLQTARALRRNHAPPMRAAEWRAALLYALLGVCINQLMFLKGLSLTSAHEAAILITTIPIFTLLVAFLLSTEQLTMLKVAGIGLAALGALLIVGYHPNSAGGSRLAGDLCILINCMAYGSFLVVSRPMFRARPALPVVADIFLLGTLLMLPFCIPALLATRWSAIPAEAWWALGAVIAGPTVGAYLLSAWALARAESSIVAAYTYVQPFLASLLAALFLGESLKAVTLVAATLIIAGVALSTFRRPEIVAETETSVI